MLSEYLAGRIWFRGYSANYWGARVPARMTVVRLNDGGLWLHSPGELDQRTVAEIQSLGAVTAIVAPGNFHHLHVADAQQYFPDAATYICPGVERKQPGLDYTGLLSDEPPGAWRGELEQVVVRGTRWMWEVAFFHVDTRTLILVDLIENFPRAGERPDRVLRLWLKWVFRMWGRPAPAPEYRMGWGDRAVVRGCLERILQWPFDRVIVNHGDPVECRAHEVARDAWRAVLGR